MNRNHRTLATALLVSAVGFSLQASAQNTPDSTKPPDSTSPSSAGQMQQDTPPTDEGQKHAGMSKAQRAFMKDCMTKAKQANNGMSESDMHKSCKDQMKANVGSGQSGKPVTPAQ